MIDVEFHGRGRGNKEVQRAWNSYRDHLNPPHPAPEQIAEWTTRKDGLFVALLYKMSVAVGYDFEELLIRKGVYFPRGLGQIEDDQSIIRTGFVELLQGQRPLKVPNYSKDSVL